MNRIKPQRSRRTSEQTKRGPERSCITCRTRRAPQFLLRLACSPNDAVILDHTGRLPGRGVYVCFEGVCLRQALQVGKLATAFRRAVTVPTFASAYHEAIAFLTKRLGTCLGLAQKAGAVISGHTALGHALSRGMIVCLVITTDIAPTRAEEYRAWGVQWDIPCLRLFTKESLGNLLGKTHRSAVGLTENRFREMLCTTATLLEQLCAYASSAKAPSGLSNHPYIL